ncbi:hypothetical protein FHS29_005013 [Saccharothrix tamanrassetensis]|uniref:Uncharacterized protein n=1 Tax=Saccharothrix tamanrassetensis TaxID=1051531 RepID=A0A841CQY8_9PSEU|nr:hypothetical protein [Saccharothrix tamanrassetensis]MBB5958405.1 hypothetical protein [Saccharothrix tamanrassetensis]
MTLFSVRSLTILALAMVIGFFACLAAGIPAGIGAAQAAGVGVGVTVGVLSGMAAGMLTALGVAGTLNTLVGSKH